MKIPPQEIAKICEISGMRAIDFFLATFLAEKEQTPKKKNIIFAIGLLVAARLAKGYIFLDLKQIPEQIPALESLLATKIDFSDWEKETYQSFANNPTKKPLVLENKKIYFQKFFQYQKQIIDFFQRNHSYPLLEQKKFLTESTLDKTQNLALITAFHYPVSIISGGPGTGKTFLIGKFLEQLQKKPLFKEQLTKVALLSFTGKAVRRIKEQLPIDKMEAVFSNCFRSENIFLNISTIHSLLRNKKDYYYNKEKEQFLWDWLIIDETSMVDLALICSLLKQLAPHTKTVFIGDSFQLNPIDAGHFFFDICRAMQQTNSPYFVLLEKPHRFQQDPKNQVLQLVDNLFNKQKPKLEQQAGLIFFQEQEIFYQTILTKAKEHWLALTNADSPQVALEIYHRLVILCALNISNFGVIAIQNRITNELEKLGKKKKNQNFYHGRPILIQTNSAALGIYNGDIGICFEEKGNYKVYFREHKGFFALNCNDLPQHQSAYAISIHKSQGSEFEEVLICLPKDYNEILHRELLYTAITRAKKKATILTPLDILEKTLQTEYQETTDLKEQFLKNCKT